jgi:hypothetical protein
MKVEKMAAGRMAAERAKAKSTTAGQAMAKREAADGLEKRAKTDWKLALSSIGGVSWVGAGRVETEATAGMAMIGTAAALMEMAYRMRAA